MRKPAIVIRDAFENNLKHVSLEIPKDTLTVFTGVSGSGKSSLVFDTIAACSRRELNDTFPAFVQHYLPKYGRPHVGEVRNLPAAIVVDQKKPTASQRSTVGTYTDTYSLLRLLFSRAGKPFAGYSDVFSFNHPEGSCPKCMGLGEVNVLDIHKLVDFDKSLNDEGCIHYHAFEPGQWRWRRYAASGFFDLNKKIRDYTPEELELFLYSDQIRVKNPPKEWPKTAKYEGLVTRMYRSVINSEEGRLKADLVGQLCTHGICPECHGARLSRKVLACKLNGLNIAEVCDLQLSELKQWLNGVTDPIAADIRESLGRRIDALNEIGLGYIALSRSSSSLSGGELQRCKIARYMTSSLSDLVYILDEPTAGLHADDVHRMIAAIKKLRDSGNTVLAVEHSRAMIREADHIVEIGPGSGSRGGRICFEGSYEALTASDTETGRALTVKMRPKPLLREASGWFELKNVSHHNLKNISVRIPLGVFTVIAGVAGSGKTSLMEVFHEKAPEDCVFLDQKGTGASLRSTPATYLGIADEIRRIFARRCGVSSGLFSFNSEGRCPVCQGKGVVITNMSFMDPIETVCEACGGLRYSPEALKHTVDGMNIAQVMDLPVEKARSFFRDTAVSGLLQNLADVGLSYLNLNQALSSMSGGEQQRLKLSSVLAAGASRRQSSGGTGLEGTGLKGTGLEKTGRIYILDEPTSGLHPSDARRIIALFDRMTDEGNTLIAIDHSLDMLLAADWTIELGPGGGSQGGHILYEGAPAGMLSSERSITGRYLKAELGIHGNLRSEASADTLQAQSSVIGSSCRNDVKKAFFSHPRI